MKGVDRFAATEGCADPRAAVTGDAQGLATLDSGSWTVPPEPADAAEVLATAEFRREDVTAEPSAVPSRARPDRGVPLPRLSGYEVTGRLGEGGMGVVWRGVQLSTRREVAIKLMGAGSFGSERARARFEREVELTARLEHPHIARVYDAGVQRGVCFYAMELIDGGVPLDDYVGQGQLSRRGMLELMRDICRAVQHAHQRGIIHRDLKPGNVLVTGDGTPKVLDFGLAKAVMSDGRGGESAVTIEGEVAGTPAYMSPEQAAGKVEQLDTRTDVYSLGVMLYRLLTGHSPHDLSGTYIEVLRRVSDNEVRRPRSVSPDLDRELDALLLKALAREPDRRYASAGELAQDVDNYLAGEPLTARPATTVYLLRRRLWKHRVPVGAAAGVMAVLVGLTLYGAVRIRREATAARVSAADARQALSVAETQRRDAQETLAFLRNALASPGRKAFDVTVLDALKDVEQQLSSAKLSLAGREAVRLTLAEMFCELGMPQRALPAVLDAIAERALAAPGSLDELGEASLCEAMAVSLHHLDGFQNRDEIIGWYTRAAEIRQRLQPGAPETELTRTELAMLNMHMKSRPHGERMFLESVARVMAPGKPLEQVRAELMTDVHQMHYLWQAGKHAAALAYTKRRLKPYLENPISAAEVPDALGRAGMYLLTTGDAVRAETLGRLAVAMSAELHGKDSPTYAMILAYTGSSLLTVRGGEDGIEMLREARQVAAKRLGPLHEETVHYTVELARGLRRFGLGEDADRIRADLIAQAGGDTAEAVRDRARVFRSLGDGVAEDGHSTAAERARAKADLRQAFELAGRDPSLPDYLEAALAYESALHAAREWRAAERVCRGLLEQVTAQHGVDDRRTAAVLRRLARNVQATGAMADAVSLLRQACDALEAAAGEPEERAAAMRDLADALRAGGRPADELAALKALVAHDEQLLGEQTCTIDDMCLLARALARQNDPRGAAEWFDRADALAVKSLGEGNEFSLRIRKERDGPSRAEGPSPTTRPLARADASGVGAPTASPR